MRENGLRLVQIGLNRRRERMIGAPPHDELDEVWSGREARGGEEPDAQRAVEALAVEMQSSRPNCGHQCLEIWMGPGPSRMELQAGEPLRRGQDGFLRNRPAHR